MNANSSNSAARFLADFPDNLALRERLEQAGTAEEKLAIIRAEGYTFTREEWEAALQASTESSLPDEALEGVAGGVVLTRGKDGQLREVPSTDLGKQIREFFSSLFS